MFTFNTNPFMAGVLASPVKRCPPGLNCGVGPECTIYDCSTEDCASAPVCQKRDPTPVSHVCPQICNDQGLCGCALESSLAKVKRDPTPVSRECPFICSEDGVCGCALETSPAKV